MPYIERPVGIYCPKDTTGAGRTSGADMVEGPRFEINLIVALSKYYVIYCV